MKTLSTRRVITILFHYCSAPTSLKCYKLRKQVKKWPVILLPTISFVESPFWQKKTSKWLPALLFVWNCPIRLAGSNRIPGIIAKNQWRFQDFHEGGANSQRGCGKLFFPKTAWKWKEFNPRGGGEGESLASPWICQC